MAEGSPHPLPVAIAGAGPCGLMAALVLQRLGVPSVLFDRASRDRLVADVGSGFDIQPTCLRIFGLLGLPLREFCTRYGGMHCMRLDDGRRVRALSSAEDLGGVELWAAQRSALQRMLLDALGDELDLRCGVAVAGFEEEADAVLVRLSDGSALRARALLGCDGIKSAVRAALHGAEDDPLHFCGVQAWWGAVPLEEASPLRAAVESTQLHGSSGTDYLWYLGTGEHPGCAMGAPASALGEGSCPRFLWAMFFPCAAESEAGDDLTRRGGVVGERAKSELERRVAGKCELVRELVRHTPADDVTMVGLYDRANLQLPFVSAGGRVALLGDAAHPQTPFLGLGVNMAITDAFVCALRLAKQPAAEACRSYACERRVADSRTVVMEARTWAARSVTVSKLWNWALRAVFRWTPAKYVIGDILRHDQLNAEFLDDVLADLRVEADMLK